MIEKIKSLNLDIRIVMLFSTFLLQWIQLFNLGFARIKIVSIITPLVIAIILLDKETLGGWKKLVKEGYYIFVWQLVYSATVLLSILWSDSVNQGLFFIIKQISYVILGITLILLLIRHALNFQKAVNSLYFASFMAVIFFLIACLMAPNGLKNITGIISGTSVDAIQTSIRRLIISFSSFSAEGAKLKFNSRHDVVGLLILYAFVVKSMSYKIKKHKKIVQPFLIIAEFTLYIFTGWMTLFGLSRQSLLSAVVMLFVVAVIHVVRHVRQKKVPQHLSKVFMASALILLVVVLLFSPYLENTGKIIYERMLLDNDAYEGRLELNQKAFDFVNQYPLQGGGAGILVGNEDDKQIHNFFLLSWYQSGYLGFRS